MKKNTKNTKIKFLLPSSYHPFSIALLVSPSPYHPLPLTLSFSPSFYHTFSITLSLSPSFHHTLFITLFLAPSSYHHLSITLILLLVYYQPFYITLSLSPFSTTISLPSSPNHPLPIIDSLLSSPLPISFYSPSPTPVDLPLPSHDFFTPFHLAISLRHPLSPFTFLYHPFHFPTPSSTKK